MSRIEDRTPGRPIWKHARAIAIIAGVAFAAGILATWTFGAAWGGETFIQNAVVAVTVSLALRFVGPRLATWSPRKKPRPERD